MLFNPTAFPSGVSAEGVAENLLDRRVRFSLYGASKVASEILLDSWSMEPLTIFPRLDQPLRRSRWCGSIRRPDQGIFSYWLHTWKQRRPLEIHRLRRRTGTKCADCLQS